MPPKNPDKQFVNFWIIVFAAVILLAVFSILIYQDTFFLESFWYIISNFWWIILPIPMWRMFIESWGEYTAGKWLGGQEYVLLEMIVPADVEKSPKVMEQLFNGLHTHSTSNKLEQYAGWRPIQSKYSFEIASHEGDVRFYVRCPDASRNAVEAHIYAYYPEAELFEAEDYTQKTVPKVMPNRDWDIWGSVIKLLKDESLPIRTYPYFKEDVTGQMIDPLASLAEVMSSIGKDEHIWYQLVFTPEKDIVWRPSCDIYMDEISKKSKLKKGGFLGGFFGDIFGELGVVPANVFRGFWGEELFAPVEVSSESEEESEFNVNKLTPSEQEKLKAVGENISRSAFNSLIRFVYMGKGGAFNKARGVAGIMSTTKQFSDVNLNSLGTDNRTKTFANYYFTETRLAYRQRKIIDDYRSRNYSGSLYILHTDELATLFHFPDMSVKAPNISRIETKKSEAPVDLPVDVEFEES